MATWLLKTEPDDYSFGDLHRDGSTVWDGVRNPQARQFMREVAPGDSAFIYHTGGEKAIVGLARVTSAAYADPKEPGDTADGRIKAPVFDIEPVAWAARPVELARVKGDDRFAEFGLVRQSRLGVMPVPAALAKVLRGWAGL